MLSNHLLGFKVEPGLQTIILDIAKAVPILAKSLKSFMAGMAGSTNVYGEKQLRVDVESNDLFVNVLKKNPQVRSLASEELPDEVICSAGNEGYSVAFDPLDGSSLVDVNLSIGSIFGIYKGKGFIGKKGSDQVASLIVVYGPRLTIMLTIGQGVFEFLYNEELEDFAANGSIHLTGDKKMFAPGNLRACKSEEWYVRLLNHWVMNEYTLRYSGGMVPDVNQILKKGSGIFTYPGYKEQPQGKLRLLYECAPMALLAEQAGGKATNGKQRILDMVVEKLDQRTPIFLGASKEVELVETFLG